MGVDIGHTEKNRLVFIADNRRGPFGSHSIYFLLICFLGAKWIFDSYVKCQIVHICYSRFT